MPVVCTLCCAEYADLSRIFCNACPSLSFHNPSIAMRNSEEILRLLSRVTSRAVTCPDASRAGHNSLSQTSTHVSLRAHRLEAGRLLLSLNFSSRTVRRRRRRRNSLPDSNWLLSPSSDHKWTRPHLHLHVFARFAANSARSSLAYLICLSRPFRSFKSMLGLQNIC